LFDGSSGAAIDALTAKDAFVEIDLGALFAVDFNDGYGACGAIAFADMAGGSAHDFYV
jgi:hypothetical protein